MTTITEPRTLNPEPSPKAADLAALNECIRRTEAILAGYKAERRRMLARIEADRIDGTIGERLDDAALDRLLDESTSQLLGFEEQEARELMKVGDRWDGLS